MAQEASHMLGQFLVRNRVLSATQLSDALDQQKRVGRSLAVLALAEHLLGEDELALLYARLQTSDETIEEAILGLELLRQEEIAEARETPDFRIPLGLVLQKLGQVRRKTFKTWLGKFERQKFDRTRLHKQLKKNPVFAPLPARSLAKLSRSLSYKYHTAGEFIYRSGEKSNGIYVVESGLVRIMVSIRDDQRVTGSCQNGDMFGVPGVLTATPREESALAITDTVSWRISNSDFLRIMHENPRVAEMAARQIGSVYQSSIHHLRHKTRINESKIAAVFFAPGADPEHQFAAFLFDSLTASLPPKSLIISTLPGFAPKGMRSAKRAATPAQAVLRPTKRADVQYVALQTIEDSEAVETEGAEWLRQAVEHFSTIVLFVTPGTREFRRFLMGLARRSVTLVRQEFPDYLKFLKSGRDRIYQLTSNSHARDLQNRNHLLVEAPDTLVPNLIGPNLEVATADRIARWISGKSVGIAFGGGGARALSHLGVLEVLEKTGLVIDMISGASAGAHVGGMIAAGKSLPWIQEYFMRHSVLKRGHPFNDYTFPKYSFIRGRKYHNLLRTAFGDLDMADTRMPFFPLATDMQSGRSVVLRSGKMADAVLASGSVPGIFPPVARSEGVLADGGMLNNIPANILKDWDTSFVISINTSIDPARSLFQPSSIGRIMLQALDIFMVQSVKAHEEHTDFEIKPDVDAFSVTDHRKGLQIIEAGRAAGRKALPHLLRALKKHGISK